MERLGYIEGGLRTSKRTAIARRCCLAIAVSFCCTIRRRLIASLSCTLIFDTRDDEGAILRTSLRRKSFEKAVGLSS